MSEQGAAASGTADEQSRLRAAIAACEHELAQISREAAPREWAMVQLRLSEALTDLADLLQDDFANADELRTRARRSLEPLYDAVALPPLDQAMLQMRLSRLVRRPLSIQLCHEAVSAIPRDDAPELWGTAQRCLAEAILAGMSVAEHDPPNTLRSTEFLPLLDTAVQAGREAVSAVRAAGPLVQANVVLVRALMALGRQRSDASLLDEAIALAKATIAGCGSEIPTTDRAAAHAALGNAALARARISSGLTPHHGEAVWAHRAALALSYGKTGSFRQLSRDALGIALILLAECRSETVGTLLAGNQAGLDVGSAEGRISFAVDVLAAAAVLARTNVSAAMELLAVLKRFADRANETLLWEGWATGIDAIAYWIKEPVRKDHLLEELAACVEAHGTPDMRLAFARVAAPGNADARPVERQRAVLARIRALADRHPEPLLRAAWAHGALCYLQEAMKKDKAAVARMLEELETYAAATGDPNIWRVWADAICLRLSVRDYSEANLDLARALLARAHGLLGARGHGYWPRAAATIHDILLTRDQPAAGPLRAEIKAHAVAAKNDQAWDAWMDTTVSTIKQIRMTDYEAARELMAELGDVPSGTREYHHERALASARKLLEDREVKLAHGFIDEILEPLELGAQATETGSSLRVSRLDACKAPDLHTVGPDIHCRELLLTGTAIEEVPDGVHVTQRLDVSECRRLKRLPGGLKVGQLSARGCTALEALPAGLDVSYLDLTGCSALKALPADLAVRRGRLSLRGCERLTALPDTIGPLAHLDISGCLNITSIPPPVVVTAWVDVGGSGLTALPPHLDGVAIRWRGVLVDERIAFRPETLEVREILAETNVERRRVMMERYGLDRFMDQAQVRVLDRDRDAGGPRRLLRIDLADDEPLVCVSVICPTTGRQFMLRVPPTMTSCRQAVAWTAGFDDPDAYQPAVET